MFSLNTFSSTVSCLYFFMINGSLSLSPISFIHIVFFFQLDPFVCLLMGKLRFGKVLESLICMSSGSASSCFCGNNNNNVLEDDHDEFEGKPLVDNEELMRLKDEFDKPKTLAFQLKPKTVVLRVSMHCYGCARKVEKHISKIQGVTSYQVDLETKMVVVIGDIMPFEVLESVSKVMKNAQLWTLSPIDRS